jgi:hypothetical protein
VVDSGTSYHTTPDVGTLSYSHPSHSSLPSSIVVGNSSTLPVTSVGDSVLPRPFHLKNVLVAPHIIQNLLTICRFTTDNSCSIEFDPFGISVKNLATRTLLARCDSSGSLHTLQLSASSTATSSSHALGATTSCITWYYRLRHPRPEVMSKLSSSSVISCSKGHFDSL